jgi:hypothetical protein
MAFLAVIYSVNFVFIDEEAASPRSNSNVQSISPVTLGYASAYANVHNNLLKDTVGALANPSK